MDFTLAAFEMPILRREYSTALAAVAPDDIQLIPATVDGRSEEYDIVNVLSVLSCLDEQRSDVSWWPRTADLEDMTGKYLTVSNIHVDASRIGSHQIFRLKDWEVALIVSDAARRALLGSSGSVFQPV